jgi:hypothetical protein
VLCCLQCLGDQFLPGGQATVKKHWLLITAILVVSAGAIGCYLPTIWGALALVGATTSTVQAFIIPGLVIMSVERAAAKAIAAAAAAPASRANGTAAWAAQSEAEQRLSMPLLADAGDADAAAAAAATHSHVDARRGRSSHASRFGPPAVAAAASEALFKVDRAPQPVWLCVMRRVVAAFAVAVGVGLFLNSVLEALWRYAHPHAEGTAVGAMYRMLSRHGHGVKLFS